MLSETLIVIIITALLFLIFNNLKSIVPAISFIISSILFAFMHYSYGSIGVVIWDVFGVFIDSILFGIIFTRTKNIFALWIGHYLSDLIGIVCFFIL